MSGCRIGKVCLKAGGEVRLLNAGTASDDNVIAPLVDILGMARREEIVSVAFVAVHERGVITTGWGNPGEDVFMLLGGLDSLKTKITDQFVQD